MRVFRFLASILQLAIVISILHYTGLLAGISESAQSMLFKSGIRDVGVDTPVAPESFDFSFNVKNLDGEVKKMKDFRGKVVFLNLWATWCGPCRVEMPSIQNLYSKLDKENIEFVILSIDNPGQERRVKRYVEQNGYSFPVFTPVSHLTDQLQVPSIPTTFVIDRKGDIVMKRVGATNFDTEKFKKFLEKLAAN